MRLVSQYAHFAYFVILLSAESSSPHFRVLDRPDCT